MLASKGKCTGCGVCYAICPKNAIRMEEDAEGFLAPELDKANCIDCGLCKKSCPVTKVHATREPLECFGGFSLDRHERLASSSGGIFSLLARYTLKQNGVVCGCAWDEDFIAKHIMITSLEELPRLRESKYVQSDATGIYEGLAEYLSLNQKVLFAGTPCQVAGVRSFLSTKPLEENQLVNLYCVDLVCHGVPSPAVWKRNLDEIRSKYDSKLREIHFRNKKTGWKNFTLRYLFDNGDEYSHTTNNPDTYWRLFLENVDLRNSCYECQFKLMTSKADLTLGDFWCVWDMYPELYDDFGTSEIIVHTHKGKELLEAISSHCHLKLVELNRIVPSNSAIQFSMPKSPIRKRFFKQFRKGLSLENALEQACKPTLHDQLYLFKRRLLGLFKGLLI